MSKLLKGIGFHTNPCNTLVLTCLQSLKVSSVSSSILLAPSVPSEFHLRQNRCKEEWARQESQQARSEHAQINSSRLEIGNIG